MIKIKDIDWVKNAGSNYWMAFVRDVMFLQLVQFDEIQGTQGKWYIHTTFPTFHIKGNHGLKEWGWMSLEEAKIKAEDLIKKELLSFIDIRDYNLNKLL